MKTALILAALAAFSLGSTGCSTTGQKSAQSNLGNFVQKLSEWDIDASQIHQSTSGPFYNHTEKASAITHSPGHFAVEDATAEVNIPMPVLGIPLLHWEVGASHVSGTKHGDSIAPAPAAPAQPATK